MGFVSKMVKKLLNVCNVGSIVSLDILGSNLILLNTIETLKDLYDKRGSIYSDRPTFVVMGELVGFDQVCNCVSLISSLRLIWR